MLVGITWHDGALTSNIDVPDEIDNDAVTDYLEEQHGARVKKWTPLSRRADPSTPQPFSCPYCGDQKFEETGYSAYFVRGEMTVSSDGTEFEPDGTLRTGDDYLEMEIRCFACLNVIRQLGSDPLATPDPDVLRARIDRERQQLAEEEHEHLGRRALEWENDAGMQPNIEALGSVEAYDAGVEAGIELATGAALRASCGNRAYLARNDWRLSLARFAASTFSEDGARLIILRPHSGPDVASRIYPAGAYKTTQQMMQVAHARQTRVQNESEGNVYVARRYPAGRDYPAGVEVYTGPHTLLIEIPYEPADAPPQSETATA
jgi:hypothetical protein